MAVLFCDFAGLLTWGQSCSGSCVAVDGRGQSFLVFWAADGKPQALWAAAVVLTWEQSSSAASRGASLWADADGSFCCNGHRRTTNNPQALWAVDQRSSIELRAVMVFLAWYQSFFAASHVASLCGRFFIIVWLRRTVNNLLKLCG